VEWGGQETRLRGKEPDVEMTEGPLSVWEYQVEQMKPKSSMVEEEGESERVNKALGVSKLCIMIIDLLVIIKNICGTLGISRDWLIFLCKEVLLPHLYW
jgi:hypothetical protein